MEQPPIQVALDASSDIEQVADGFVVSSELVSVRLSTLLLERLTTNVWAARKRAEANA